MDGKRRNLRLAKQRAADTAITAPNKTRKPARKPPSRLNATSKARKPARNPSSRLNATPKARPIPSPDSDYPSSTISDTKDSDTNSRSGSTTPRQYDSDASSIMSSVPQYRRMLSIYQMKVFEKSAPGKYPEAYDAARRIVNGRRHSAMEMNSQADFVAIHKKVSFRNEATFAGRVWKKLLRDKREKEVCSKKGDDDLEDCWRLEFWDKDHLDFNLRKSFIHGCVSLFRSSRPSAAAALGGLPKLKDPRPDIAYGLSSDAFTEEENAINDAHQAITGLSPGILHTFFIVEFKGQGGTIDEAMTQACGAGAAMVNAFRQLNRNAGVKCSSRADVNSFAFSLALVPHMANLSVHWAEVKDREDEGPESERTETVTHHMNLLQTYSLTNELNVRDLRHDINNVLDWGVLTKKAEIKERLAAISATHRTESIKSNLIPSSSTPRKRKAGKTELRKGSGIDGSSQSSKRSRGLK